MNPVFRYILNNLLALDQTWNVRFGGCPDETISSRLGRIKQKNGGKIPAYRPIARFLAWGLDKIQKNHCENAIETDEAAEIREQSLFDK